MDDNNSTYVLIVSKYHKIYSRKKYYCFRQVKIKVIQCIYLIIRNYNMSRPFNGRRLNDIYMPYDHFRHPKMNSGIIFRLYYS